MSGTGSAQVMYGWCLTDEEYERFENDGVDPYDFAKEHGLDYDFGGDLNWDHSDQQHVIGLAGKWFSELGAHPIKAADFIVESDSYKMDHLVQYFGREPQKFLVINYG